MNKQNPATEEDEKTENENPLVPYVLAAILALALVVVFVMAVLSMIPH
jgi:hypothetical protein